MLLYFILTSVPFVMKQIFSKRNSRLVILQSLFHICLVYHISGNYGAMEILALLADDKNTPN